MPCDAPIRLGSLEQRSSASVVRAMDHQFRLSVTLVGVLLLATLSVTLVNLL